MPIISSAFAPPFWLRNGHVQTVLPVLWPRRTAVRFEREIFELPDGDFLHLDWSKKGHDRLAVLSHGLEGDTEASYIRGAADALQAAGWDVLAWCFRNCGPEPNRLVRSYHSGETGDLRAIVERAAPAYRAVALIGFSLGGNLVLKYLGEEPPSPAVVAGVAISAPVDLGSSAARLDGWRNAIYRRRFLTTLIRKTEAKAQRFPGQLDVSGIRRLRSIREFDERYTAPLHGFRDAADYYVRSSSRPVLRQIGVPALLLNARNDPLLSRECFPAEVAREHPFLHLEVPDSGGHVGFLDLRQGVQPWHERRLVEFLGKVEKAPSRGFHT